MLKDDNFNEIKDAILNCFDLIEMKEYLKEHFSELNDLDILYIVTGVLKPIQYKLMVSEKILNQGEDFIKDLDIINDFRMYVEICKKALDDLYFQKDDKSVYLLYCYSYDGKDDESWQFTKPFFSLVTVLDYIKNRRVDWLGDCLCENDNLIWFRVEKWTGQNNLELRGTYFISQGGEIWDYQDEESKLYFSSVGVSNALGLNLPVPFSSGDVISIDCQPFAAPKPAVVVSVGDNKDCCSVQCLYLEDGNLYVGALKHSKFWKFYLPQVSPLYKVKRIKDVLGDGEKLLIKVGTVIKKLRKQIDTSSANNKYNDELLNKVYRITENGCSPEKFLKNFYVDVMNNK